MSHDQNYLHHALLCESVDSKLTPLKSVHFIRTIHQLLLPVLNPIKGRMAHIGTPQ